MPRRFQAERLRDSGLIILDGRGIFPYGYDVRHMTSVILTRERWTEEDHLTTSRSTEADKALVLEGIKGVFIKRDPTVIDRLFSADDRQRHPQIPNGPAAIKALLGQLPSGFNYEPGLVMADGEDVSIQGRYIGWGPKPTIAIDVFRVAYGKIAEHGDVMQKEVPASQSANGNSMFLGS